MADENATTSAGTPAGDDSTAGSGADGSELTSASAAPAKKAAKRAPAKKAAAKKAPAKKAAKKAVAPQDAPDETSTEPAAPRKRTSKKTAAAKEAPSTDEGSESTQAPTTKSTSRRTAKKSATSTDSGAGAAEADSDTVEKGTATTVLFQAPEAVPAKKTSKRAPAKKKQADAPSSDAPATDDTSPDATASGEQTPRADAAGADAGAKPKPSDDSDSSSQSDSDADSDGEGDGAPRRRRRRGGRRRRKGGGGGNGDSTESTDEGDSNDGQSNQQGDQQANQQDKQPADDGQGTDEDGEGSTRRRRRRRREGDSGNGPGDDPQNTVTRVRKPRSAEDEITAVAGSTRLEAKKQRRREGREAGRRRAPIVSEAEFLARREAVERVMVIRQKGDLTQIGVLEDKVLVEHYVARESQASMIGNVYLGRVQNVLPSMEAAFIDIGKGRNAVLYAGEVNWSAMGHKEGSPRKIESVLTSGQPVLVQVTKDPVGHKGARLTSQISMAGRFLVYVPDGNTSGISRKLPDTERNRLKSLLREIVPDSAGVIVRTAAEGASEEELTRDVERLKARWEDIEAMSQGKAPALLYGEPDLTLKVVRDLFTEDFAKLVIQGDEAWATVQGYVSQVAPDLADRLVKDDDEADIFATYRVDEQIAKALDRKVWLPSGGSLIIDRTEAMTVIDVNTGKFTGSGGNLEETVTKNNLEAAEEVVRQLRLRDIGGIIVVDFIDMVLESNRDLVLRRMVECLGRDRTRHQVAEVTSLGLVQMTRKRIGVGLVESFSHNCEHCQGRGVVIQDAPVEPKNTEDDRGRSNRRRGANSGSGDSGGSTGGRGGKGSGAQSSKAKPVVPSPKDVAAMAKPPADEQPPTEATDEEPSAPTSTQTDSPASTSEPVETPSPQVTTRTRGRRGGGKPTERSVQSPDQTPDEQPVDLPQIAQAVAAEPTPTDAQSKSQAESEPEVERDAPSAAPEPTSTAPRVVTRTRARRSASRPAGTPSVAPPPIVVNADSATSTVAATPVDAPEPPRVVTRTRGQRATRAAGPPSVSVADSESDESPRSS